MDTLQQFLQHYGLSQKEAAVYVACLRQGDGTVLQIARQANIKRPTTYVILEDLVTRGLVRSKKDRKSIHYFPQ
jgi:sugar-specific transcriptional regulator TrmB